MPKAISVSSDGTVNVDDRDNRRIQHFNAKGEFIKQVNWASDGEPTDFLSVDNVAFASDGSFWLLAQITDQTNQSVTRTALYHLSRDGLLMSELPLPFLSTIFGVAPDGSVWVASETRQLYHYKTDGTLLETTRQQDYIPKGITVVADGSLWLVSNNLFHIKPDGTLIAKFGTDGEFYFHSQGVNRIVVTADNSIWLADTGNNLIKKMTPDGKFQAFKSGTVRLSSPVLATDGSLWFSDTANQKTLHFDAKGSFLGTFLEPEPCIKSSQSGHYTREITLAPDKTLWLLEKQVSASEFGEFYYGKACIRHMSEHGQVLKQFQSDIRGVSDTGTNEWKNLAIAPDGSVWIVNGYPNQAEHYSAEGEKLGELSRSTLGTDIGFADYLTGLTVADDFTIWVGDNTGHIRQFNAQGKLLRQFGHYGNGIGQYNHPSAIHLAADNTVWILDGNNRIQHVSLEGQFIEQVTAGKPSLDYMFSDFALGADTSLWINVDGGKLQKFSRQALFENAAEFFNYAYDDFGRFLSIHDLRIGDTHYQVEMFSYDSAGNLYGLSSLNFANNQYALAADYDPETQLLTLPQVAVDKKLYRAVFKGDAMALKLLEAIPLEQAANQ